jgi:hypothetical protein
MAEDRARGSPKQHAIGGDCGPGYSSVGLSVSAGSLPYRTSSSNNAHVEAAEAIRIQR